MSIASKLRFVRKPNELAKNRHVAALDTVNLLVARLRLLAWHSRICGHGESWSYHIWWSVLNALCIRPFEDVGIPCGKPIV